MKLNRYENNPIITPDPASDWENICTTNPAAWRENGTIHMLYRGGPDTDEHPVFFGHATSTNGYDFVRTSASPVFGPSKDGFDSGCVEDPRIIKFGDTYFVTYAARMFYPGAYWKHTVAVNHFNPKLPPEAPEAVRENITRTGLALTKDFRNWQRLGPITRASVDNRDVIIFPEKIEGDFVMMHRPATWVGPAYAADRPSIWMSFSKDLLVWPEDHILARPEYAWESLKIGGGTPPIKTEQGWITLYHGVDDHHVYRTGALLLDLKDPLHILGRSPEPILEPEMDYEKEGLVPNVVFPCGSIVLNDELIVYYGGADKVCCVASCNLQELIDHLLANPFRG